MRARRALLFDVGNLTVCCDFPVPAGHASATERRETEKTDQTHHADPRPDTEQFLYRRVCCRLQLLLNTVGRGSRLISACFRRRSRVALRSSEVKADRQVSKTVTV